MHNKAKVSQDNNKPEIVHHYKGGVVAMEQMVHAFTWNRKTKRWLMVMFFNMVDLASIASRAVFWAKFPMKQLSHEDNCQRFNLKASRALGPCTDHAPCTNPDPARMWGRASLPFWKHCYLQRLLHKKGQRKRWHCPKEAEEMLFLSCETWLQNQIDFQQMSPSFLSKTLTTLLPSKSVVSFQFCRKSLYLWMQITVSAKNVEGNSISGWITCIPYYNVPGKRIYSLRQFWRREKKREYF